MDFGFGHFLNLVEGVKMNYKIETIVDFVDDECLVLVAENEKDIFELGMLSGTLRVKKIEFVMIKTAPFCLCIKLSKER